jgi:hypothetical protein
MTAHNEERGMHSPEWTARILLRVLVLGGVGLGAFLLLRRRVPGQPSLRPGCWFCFPYWFGAVSCVLGLVVPEPEWHRPIYEGGPPFTMVVAGTGLGLLLLGTVTHLVLWRRGRLARTGDGRSGPLAALALAALAVVFRWLERSGVSVGLWLGLFLGGCLVLTFILWVLHAYVRGRNALSTRMGRLIVAGRAAEAIELGEAVPPEARDAFVLHSLAAAYCESGDLDRAEALFTELRARPDLPGPVRKLSDGWMERIAERRAAAAAMGTTEQTEHAEGDCSRPGGSDGDASRPDRRDR